MNGHNQAGALASDLGLSAVAQDSPHTRRVPHVHSARLCRTCTVVRFRALNPRPLTPTAVRAEAIAEAIRTAHGNVWPAVVAFGICYSHATSIRRGWRPGGVVALPIRYRSRGYLPDGRRPGWSTGVGVA